MTTAESDYRVFGIDGFHPGSDAVAVLNEALGNPGTFLSVRSNEEYILNDEDEEIPGWYAYVLVAKEVPLEPIADALRTWASAMTRSLVWAGLLSKIGDSERAREHEATAEILGLDGVTFRDPAC